MVAAPLTWPTPIISIWHPCRNSSEGVGRLIAPLIRAGPSTVPLHSTPSVNKMTRVSPRAHTGSIACRNSMIEVVPLGNKFTTLHQCWQRTEVSPELARQRPSVGCAAVRKRCLYVYDTVGQTRFTEGQHPQAVRVIEVRDVAFDVFCNFVGNDLVEQMPDRT